MPRPSGPQRLPARSAILSTLLGAHPAQASSAGILAIATELGIGESAVRVALTRMVAAGDLDRADGIYRLSGRLSERQRRQDESIRPAVRPWNGHWWLAVISVPSDDAPTRNATRTALTGLRFGELREGVWMRPTNLEVTLDDPVVAERVSMFNAEPEEPADELAERLFAPTAWADEARQLVAALDRGVDMQDRFEVAARVVRHIMGDPLLPDELCPKPWPGALIRERYESFRAEFAEHVGRVLGRDMN
ncbi:PaaX domain-containing protein, C- domain protein [Gordonia sp. ABSL11-1]|uniref:PaaX family transcriptional regulator C-terminal domain-containing protein n=1 Tax=Gordonia sp. ABSL11-1 TaxID=3053924 RepID=UPI002573E726|nr:PaaX family transcriptional regulator C-terminal domain-containing protein [Gordonia sp. ABSL11-1]MDL9948089.1 PaaX domain-containing protein, C- domain protein [Gordonia sp. ABSL11-1]